MSKLSFRARQLDASKPMPVYRAEEIPDLPDFQAINRAVPQMPTGMEKEEECEHHLQRAISAQQAYGHTGELVIPTPECLPTPNDYYNDLYPENYKTPRQLIHVQPFAIEQNLPEYDIDSEDEEWLATQGEVLKLTPMRFEEIIELLEKSSGQQVVDMNEAKKLIKENDDIIISAVYDYWLSKRLKVQHPLIPTVKTEKKDGPANNNPYVAFRRRTEKMQTRKNRKNDEVSYEKMLKLKRDLSKAVTLLELVRKREKMKTQHLRYTIDIFEKRYVIGDFSGQVLAEVSAIKHVKPSYATANNRALTDKNKDEGAARKRQRDNKKKQKTDGRSRPELMDHHDYITTSDDDGTSTLHGAAHSDGEEDDPDGPFAFRRTAGCSYHAPIVTDKVAGWPWESPEEGGLADPRHRFTLASFTQPSRQPFVAFIRRRIGRGGRIIFDRIRPPPDQLLPSLQPFETSIHDVLSETEGVDDERMDFEVDEDGNRIPIVKIPLCDLIRTESLFNRESETNSRLASRSKSLTQDAEHSLPSLLASSLTSSSSLYTSHHGTLNNSPFSTNPSAGVCPPPSRKLSKPATLDPETAQFAVSAIDGYTVYSTSTATSTSTVTSSAMGIGGMPTKSTYSTVDGNSSTATQLLSNGPDRRS